MIAVIVCLIVMLLLQIVAPYWWWVMLVPFGCGFGFSRTGWSAIRTGFVSAGLLWLGGSLYFLLTGSRIIAQRIAAMFGLGNPWLLILATGLISAVAAAVSGYTGYAARTLLKVRLSGKD
ncbi:MAG: hypothetical protein MUQ00_15820 [Candidatus Aminicenantes bacterium]|nr:hypothetical protein [Candidatus Aminicenantes bacterium]